MDFHKKTRTAGLLILSVLFLGLQPVAAQVAKGNEVISLKAALKEMLQDHGAAKLKKLTINVDAEKTKAFRQQHGVTAEGAYTVYQGLDADGAVIGSVMILNEQGKEGPLQALLAMRPDGQIYDVGFTVFGEDKGKGALNWNYLKQFIGKKTGEAFTLGDDIDGISGATWTSESVSKTIKRASVIYEAFFLSK